MILLEHGSCIAQFTDEEEQLQQIRGLGTDIAVVCHFTLSTPSRTEILWMFSLYFPLRVNVKTVQS